MKNVIFYMLILLMACPAFAQQPCESTADENASQKESAPSISPELDQLLDKVEQRGASLKSFQAKMAFRQEQRLIDTEKIRNGNLVYQIKDNRVKFRIHFADLQNHDLTEDQPAPPVAFDEDYAFDGLWFTIRNARLKNLQRRQLCKTPAPKEEFRLGKGPFPLPFAIQKNDVLDQFETSLVPATDKDPKDTDHLLLVPKLNSSFVEEYVRMELWISKNTLVPEQLRFEKEPQEITTISWSNIVLDQPIDDEKFNPGPTDEDWTVEEIPITETEQNK